MSASRLPALLASIGAEIADELANATFVVVDVLDVDCLTALGFAAVLAGNVHFGYGFVVGVEAPAVVLVGNVDTVAWATQIAANAPEVSVWQLSAIASPALALGHRSDTDYRDLATVDAKRATWLALVAQGAREVHLELVGVPAPVAAPAAPPAAPTPKLRVRRKRR